MKQIEADQQILGLLTSHYSLCYKSQDCKISDTVVTSGNIDFAPLL